MSGALDDSIEYMWANPPTCIKSLSATADADLKKRLVANCILPNHWHLVV